MMNFRMNAWLGWSKNSREVWSIIHINTAAFCLLYKQVGAVEQWIMSTSHCHRCTSYQRRLNKPDRETICEKNKNLIRKTRTKLTRHVMAWPFDELASSFSGLQPQATVRSTVWPANCIYRPSKLVQFSTSDIQGLQLQKSLWIQNKPGSY